MAVLEIHEWPDQVLETPAKEVTVFDERLKKFVADMHETMAAAGGIGLAANQVGSLERVLVMHIPWSPRKKGDDSEPEPKEWWHDQVFTIINPKIVKKEGKCRGQEGCLSFPGIYDFVERAKEIWVKAHDINGKEFEIHATGLLSICLQHEIDHLDGIVFIERMSRIKAAMIKKKVKRQALLEPTGSF